MDIYTTAPLLVMLMTYSLFASRVGRVQYLIGAGAGSALVFAGLWLANSLALAVAHADATGNVDNFYSDQSNLGIVGVAVWPFCWALLLAIGAFTLRKVVTGETRRMVNSLVLGLLFLVLSTGLVGEVGQLFPPLYYVDNVLGFLLGFANADIPPGLPFDLTAMPDSLAQAVFVVLAAATFMLLLVGLLRARKS
jgi:hypothetical protein